MADTTIQVLTVLGALLVLLAGIGVVRFPDVYARMHAATKASTIGIALIGAAAAIAVEGARAKVVLTVAFIFITAPAAAHLVGRATYRAEGIDVDLDLRDDLAEVLDTPPDPADGPGR